MARPRGQFDQEKKRLLDAIRLMFEQTGKVFASTKYLAELLGKSIRQTYKYLRALVKEGLLIRSTKRYWKFGHFLSHRRLKPVDESMKDAPRFGIPLFVKGDRSPPAVPAPVAAPAKAAEPESYMDPIARAAIEAFEREEQEPLTYPELRRRNAEMVRISVMNQRLGGYRRPVKHSPMVQQMIDEAERETEETAWRRRTS